VKATKGSSAVLECRAEGDSPLKVRWMREGQPVESVVPVEDITDVGVASRLDAAPRLALLHLFDPHNTGNRRKYCRMFSSWNHLHEEKYVNYYVY